MHLDGPRWVTPCVIVIHSFGLCFSRARLGSLSNPCHFAAITSLDSGFGSPHRVAGLEELTSYSIIMGLGVQVSQRAGEKKQNASCFPPSAGPPQQLTREALAGPQPHCPHPQAFPGACQLSHRAACAPRWEGLAPESCLTSSTRMNCLDNTRSV